MIGHFPSPMVEGGPQEISCPPPPTPFSFGESAGAERAQTRNALEATFWNPRGPRRPQPCPPMASRHTSNTVQTPWHGEVWPLPTFPVSSPLTRRTTVVRSSQQPPWSFHSQKQPHLETSPLFFPPHETPCARLHGRPLLVLRVSAQTPPPERHPRPDLPAGGLFFCYALVDPSGVLEMFNNWLPRETKALICCVCQFLCF